jgi:hypothetical protein
MKKLLLFLLLIAAVWIAMRSCGGPKEHPATPPAAVAPAAPKPVPQAEAISGSSLNKAFPAPADGFSVTFTQEKNGYAQADLVKGGAKVATLSISDTNANPSARDKFKSAARRVAGFPAAAVGTQGTAVLAGDRFQVQVRSIAPTFKESDREAWLARFKLAELAKAR